MLNLHFLLNCGIIICTDFLFQKKTHFAASTTHQGEYHGHHLFEHARFGHGYFRLLLYILQVCMAEAKEKDHRMRCSYERVQRHLVFGDAHNFRKYFRKFRIEYRLRVNLHNCH